MLKSDTQIVRDASKEPWPRSKCTGSEVYFNVISTECRIKSQHEGS